MVQMRQTKGAVAGCQPSLATKLLSVFMLSFVGLLMFSEVAMKVQQESDHKIMLSDLSKESMVLAKRESLGFFTDIPDSAWKRHKKRFQLTQPNYNIENPRELERHSRYSHYFWANNFEPEFTCPHEFRLGKLGDGGKWACDPHRIVSDTGNGKSPSTKGQCLVYSVGSNGNFDFEVEVLKHVSPGCEIHTFDAKAAGRRKNFAEEAKKIPGVTFHHTGLGPASDRTPHFKRFREIIKELKHESRVIDLMKIDCEKCEYAQYKEWLEDWKEMGVLVRQVMLEVHNSDMPGVVDLFNEFRKAGYVLFHKEANYMNEGKAVEVAWVLMSAEFQEPV